MSVMRFRQPGGFTKCEGLLHVERGELLLEYQIIDAWLGVLKSGVKSVRIPLERLTSIELVGNRLAAPKLILQADTMEAVQGVPGMSQGRVELRIAREDREVAQALVDAFYKPDPSDFAMAD